MRSQSLMPTVPPRHYRLPVVSDLSLGAKPGDKFDLLVFTDTLPYCTKYLRWRWSACRQNLRAEAYRVSLSAFDLFEPPSKWQTRSAPAA
jgi:hypothetical protein